VARALQNIDGDALGTGHVGCVEYVVEAAACAPPRLRRGHLEQRHEAREERIMSTGGELVDAPIGRLGPWKRR